MSEFIGDFFWLRSADPQTSIAARRVHPHSSGVPAAAGKTGRYKTWRAPDGFPPGALSSRQSACKPGSGRHADQVRVRDGHSSWTTVTRRLKQPTRTAGSGQDPEASCAFAHKTPRRSYSVLLPVGFAVPPALPSARCALTAPFHPYRPACPASAQVGRRFVFCGTVPRLAPAGCYPAPLVHGARTFLPGNLSILPERPSGRLTQRGMGA